MQSFFFIDRTVFNFRESNPYPNMVEGEITPGVVDIAEAYLVIDRIDPSVNFIDTGFSGYNAAVQCDTACITQRRGRCGISLGMSGSKSVNCFKSENEFPQSIELAIDGAVIWTWNQGDDYTFPMKVNVVNQLRQECNQAFINAEICQQGGDCDSLNRQCSFVVDGSASDSSGQLKVRKDLEFVELKFIDTPSDEPETLVEFLTRHLWLIIIISLVYIVIMFGGDKK